MHAHLNMRRVIEHTRCMSHDGCMASRTATPNTARPRAGVTRAAADRARRGAPSTPPTPGRRWSRRRGGCSPRSGFDGTGTEQIVAEARVTRGALYHHFRDKADLFRAVMAEAAGEVAQRLDRRAARLGGGVADAGDQGRGGRVPRRLRRRRGLPADRPRGRPAGAGHRGVGRPGRPLRPEPPRGVAGPRGAGRRPGTRPDRGARAADHRDADRGQPGHRQSPPTRRPIAPTSARSSTAC